MSTEFNYVVNVDTSRVMGAVSEIRSQMGMAMGSPTGFSGPSAGLPGGGFSGFGDAFAGARMGMSQMMNGLSGAHQSIFGGTHTNAAMANSPHYGMVSAQSDPALESRIASGGLFAAFKERPPGVSAPEFAMGVMANKYEREVNARHEGHMAAVETGAGVANMIVGFGAGSLAGKGLAKMIGKGGGLTGTVMSMGAGFLAEHLIGNRMDDYFQERRTTAGLTREFGEIVGSGRGLSNRAQTELGIAAHQASKDLKMDANTMGDILALGREAGIMPTADGANPAKAREQFKDFARAVEEGAQVLHTSLAGATQIIKSAAASGMSAKEGIVRASGMGVENFLNRNAFGNMGASIAEANFLEGSQGRGIFNGAMGGAGAGMSSSEIRMLGGRRGIAQMAGTTQMAMAMGPMGDMQLMAAANGNALGGDMMSVAGAALSALSDGGDVIGNYINFSANKGRIRRGVGASGLQTMAKQQIQSMADMFTSLSPGVSEENARIMAISNLTGQNDTQARATMGAIFGGRGGGGPSRAYGGMTAERQARAAFNMQGMELTRAAAESESTAGAEEKSGKWSAAKEWGAVGMAIGAFIPVVGSTAIGGAIGAAGGYLSERGVKGTLKDIWGGITGTVGAITGAYEKRGVEDGRADERKLADQKDAKLKELRDRMGFYDVDPRYAARVMEGDMSGVRLDFDAVATSTAHRANARSTAAALRLGGYKPTEAGAGTIQVDGQYWKTSDLQAVSKLDLATTIKEKRSKEIALAAGGIMGDPKLAAAIEVAESSIKAINAGDGTIWDSTYLLGAGKSIVEASGDKRLMAAFGKGGKQLNDPEVRRLLENVTGSTFELNSGGRVITAGGAAAKLATAEARTSMEKYLAAEFGLTGDKKAEKLASIIGGGSEGRFLGGLGIVQKMAKSRGIDGSGVVAAMADRIESGGSKDLDEARRQALVDAKASSSVSQKVMGTDLDRRKQLFLGMPNFLGDTLKASMADHFNMDKKTTKNLRPDSKRGGSRSKSFEKTIGWGQQEDAMSSINRSLKLTEKALKKSNDAIAILAGKIK